MSGDSLQALESATSRERFDVTSGPASRSADSAGSSSTAGPPAADGRSTTIDKATLLGVLVGFGGIALGLVLEGGSLLEIVQPTAALIVFGGTLGATLVALPLDQAIEGFRALARLVREPRVNAPADIELMLRVAEEMRRAGILSVERLANSLPDPFTRKALLLMVDGIDPKQMRRMMEAEIEGFALRAETGSKALDAAGGFSPTIGIVGAVLGLIQVMKHLEDMDAVGRGIAVAFVATIYGVGLANLVLLPAAKKVNARAEREILRREMVLRGVLGVMEGMNPRMIRAEMESYLTTPPPPEPEATSSAPGTRREV